MPRPDTLPAWQQLMAHREVVGAGRVPSSHWTPGEPGWLQVAAGPLHADLSRHRIDPRGLELLVELAEQAGVRTRLARMLRGDIVNPTEGRAALHTALRGEGPLQVDGGDLRAGIDTGIAAQARMAEAIRSGEWRLASGEAVRHVVNLGIGGSDLGPALALEALAAQADGPACHCVADLDARALHAVLAACDPAATLFVVCSKTFGTLETLANAGRARAWLRVAGLPEAQLHRHFAGVTAAPDRAAQWGVPAAQCLHFGEWVGGRYSLWSAVSLVLQVACGPQVLQGLHAGARAIDTHFAEAPAHANLPLLMGLLGVWYRNFMGAQTHAVLPYAAPLRQLPAYLQQLEMESLGKSVDLDGNAVDWDTGGVIFGAAGSHAQHAFMQLLHQGTLLLPSDIILFDDTTADEPALNANALAQAQVLAEGGRVAAAPGEHGVLPGGQPVSLIQAATLDAETLGALLACYEHKVFTQACVWHINPFDQWGVELGKQVARELQR
ncbi:MAG: glucose-6-phosphate isomerase [Rhodocyclaceae bacterium]|nr:glucose-6-phosphate isomerase [Rhodocyclaceae bacterium]